MDKSIDKLIQYLDGDLSEAEAATVQAQLEADDAYHAELLTLTRIDRLLGETPLASPAPDFTQRFEARLDQHLTRRRNLWGAAIIGAILILSAGLMIWSLTTSGISPLSVTDSDLIISNMVDLLQGLLSNIIVALRVTSLTTGTMLKLAQQPIVWGMCSLAVVLVAVWVQLLRWVGGMQKPVTA